MMENMIDHITPHDPPRAVIVIRRAAIVAVAHTIVHSAARAGPRQGIAACACRAGTVGHAARDRGGSLLFNTPPRRVFSVYHPSVPRQVSSA
jgi:hypothetical protein